ncbi:tetratricopeptide repeat protein [Intestinibacter sp.]
MKIFKILGIDPTKDEMTIKEAYLNKLSNTNPEDKPDEFMQLRKAYEEALEYANQDDENEDDIDDSEVGRWMAKVKGVYKNFRARNDLDAWSELLKDDVCQNIGTKIDARDALLEFFMQDYYLPSAVIRLLNEFFNFEEDVKELYDEFPPEFIDNIIIGGIKYDEYPRYDLFEIEDGLDYDGFLDDFYKMNRVYKEHDAEKAYELLQDLKEYGIYHPEIEKKEIVVLYNLDRLDDAWDLACSIDERYAEFAEVDLLKGMILSEKGDYDESKKYYEAILKNDKYNFDACVGLCKIYRHEGKFYEAKNLLNELSNAGYEDPYIDELLDELNNDIINDYEDKVQNGKTDFEKGEILEIANIYYMVDKLDEAYKLVQSVEPDESTDLIYYKLLARIYIDMEDYDKALEYADIWENEIKNASQEKLNKFEKRYVDLENVYFTKAWIYNQKYDYEKSINEINKSLEILPNDITFLNAKAGILFKRNEYEEILKVCDKIININSSNAGAYMHKISALYYLNLLEEAFDECNDLIDMQPYNLFAYIYKIKILIDVEEIESAKENIKYLKDEGIENDTLSFLEALILDEEGKREEATKIYKKLIKKLEQEGEGSFEFIDELYLAYINEIFNTEEEADVLELTQKGLKYEPKNQGLLYYKGIELYLREEFEDSKEVFKYIAELYPDNGYTDRKIGDIYKEQGLYEKALEYYNKQIDGEYDIEDYFKRVAVNTELLRLDDMYKDLLFLEKHLPNDPRLFEHFGIYYNMIDNAQKSYDNLIKSKELFAQSDEYEMSSFLECNLASVCGKLGKREEAIKYYRESYENTGDASDLLSIYNQHVMVGEFDKGEEILNEYLVAMNKSKLSADALAHMANLNIEKRNIKAALKNFALMIKPEPENKRSRAELLLYTGNYKKALKLMEEVIKDSQFVDDNRYNYIVAARICIELGDKTKAEQYAKKVIKQTPIDDLNKKIDKLPHIYIYLGDAYTILGEYDKAEEYLNKALTSPRCFNCSDKKCVDAIYSLAYLEYLRGDIDAVKSYLDEIFKLDISKTSAIGLAYKLGILE